MKNIVLLIGLAVSILTSSMARAAVFTLENPRFEGRPYLAYGFQEFGQEYSNKCLGSNFRERADRVCKANQFDGATGTVHLIGDNQPAVVLQTTAEKIVFGIGAEIPLLTANRDCRANGFTKFSRAIENAAITLSPVMPDHRNQVFATIECFKK